MERGNTPHHTALNDVIHRSLTAANIPSWLEPSELYRSDGKRPKGCSIIPWKSGKVLVWDATWPNTHAPSHLPTAATQAAKFAHLDSSHFIVPFAVETSRVLGEAAGDFMRELGR